MSVQSVRCPDSATARALFARLLMLRRPSRSRPSGGVGIVIGLAVWLIVMAGCQSRSHPSTDASGLPVDRPVRQSDLLRYPEAHLYYAGSHLVKIVGANQTSTRSGEEPNAAYTGAILTSAASPGQLYQWYGQQLHRRGFDPTIDYRPSTQVSGQAWQSHRRLQIQVGVFDPARLQGVNVTVPAGTIVYEVLLVGYAPGLSRSVGNE